MLGYGAEQDPDKAGEYITQAKEYIAEAEAANASLPVEPLSMHWGAREYAEELARLAFWLRGLERSGEG